MRALWYVVLLSAFVVVSVSSLDDGGLRKKRAIGGNHGNDYFGSQGSGKISHQKGKRCYQCAWSPPKMTYASLKKPVGFSSKTAHYGTPHQTGVQYNVEKVQVKVQGGWDKCYDVDPHNAEHFGIDQLDCEHNCYTRVEKSGNVYRGCYKGEYNVNPRQLGCHHQAGSLYCFCQGDRCNTGPPPKHSKGHGGYGKGHSPSTIQGKSLGLGSSYPFGSEYGFGKSNSYKQGGRYNKDSHQGHRGGQFGYGSFGKNSLRNYDSGFKDSYYGDEKDVPTYSYGKNNHGKNNHGYDKHSHGHGYGKDSYGYGKDNYHKDGSRGSYVKKSPGYQSRGYSNFGDHGYGADTYGSGKGRHSNGPAYKKDSYSSHSSYPSYGSSKPSYAQGYGHDSKHGKTSGGYGKGHQSGHSGLDSGKYGSSYGNKHGHGSSYGDKHGHGSSYGDKHGHSSSYGDKHGHGSSYGDKHGHGSSYGDKHGHDSSYGNKHGQGTFYGNKHGHADSYGKPRSHTSSYENKNAYGDSYGKKSDGPSSYGNKHGSGSSYSNKYPSRSGYGTSSRSQRHGYDRH